MVLSAGRYHSFVVRVLRREGAGIQGEITHVGTRRSVRFTDRQIILDFISDVVETGSDREPPELSDEGDR